MSDIRDRLERAGTLRGTVSSGFGRDSDTNALKSLCREAVVEIDRLRTELAARDEQEPVPLAHADLYEAIHEACATMPALVSDDDGDTQADHLYSAVQPFVADNNRHPPAPTRPESEVKAEALDEVAKDLATTIGEIRCAAIGVRGLRNRAARLRGEGSE